MFSKDIAETLQFLVKDSQSIAYLVMLLPQTYLLFQLVTPNQSIQNKLALSTSNPSHIETMPMHPLHCQSKIQQHPSKYPPLLRFIDSPTMLLALFLQ